MNSKSLILLIFLLAPLFLAAQENNDSSSELLKGKYSFLSAKPTFGLQLGSSFTTGLGGHSLFSHSVSPQVQFQPGQRFSVVVGSVFSTGSLSGGMPFASQPEGNGRLYSNTIYAYGAYQVNSRLTLTGGAWTERNNMNAFFTPQMNPQAFNTNARGMMFGMDFRISDNLRFGAEINVSQGPNAFSPLYNNGPFQSSPFHRRNPW